MAAGIIEANRTGGTVKRMHCGWAAHAAVSAADLVRLGFTGPPTVLEGRFGFFQAWLHGAGDLDAVTDGLGSRWEVPRHLLQALPGQPLHPRRRRRGARPCARGASAPTRSSRSTLGVPAANLRTIGEPIEVKRRPTTGYMAQFCGAVRRRGRPARRRRARRLPRGLRRRARPTTRRGCDLMDRTVVEADERVLADLPAPVPGRRPGQPARRHRARGARCSPPAAGRSARCRSTSSPPSSATTPRAASTTTTSSSSQRACRDLRRPARRPDAAGATDPRSTPSTSTRPESHDPEGERMSTYDLLITGAEVVRPGEDAPRRLDVAVTDGRFAAIEERIDPAEAATVVDASGRHLFPGVVDAHQHWGIYNPLPRGRHVREQGRGAGRRHHRPHLHPHRRLLPQPHRPLPRDLPRRARRHRGPRVRRLRLPRRADPERAHRRDPRADLGVRRAVVQDLHVLRRATGCTAGRPTRASS